MNETFASFMFIPYFSKKKLTKKFVIQFQLINTWSVDHQRYAI